MSRLPNVLIFDSGLGGLTVLAEVRRTRPDANLMYVADDAGFPYGRLSEVGLVARVEEVIDRLVADHRPDAVCIACNTASTIVLKPLRSRFPDIPFVGTVPAVKPAALASRSKVIAVLATPGTVAREYTRDLVRAYAGDCVVELVGSRRLAGLAEAVMRGELVADPDIEREITPCFVERAGRRTDMIVLACTHYPLLVDQFRRVAPWPVTWVDPAPAIARRVAQVLTEALGFAPLAGVVADEPFSAVFTSGGLVHATLENVLRQRGLVALRSSPIPLVTA